jgi:hypothetical protein
MPGGVAFELHGQEFASGTREPQFMRLRDREERWLGVDRALAADPDLRLISERSEYMRTER